MHAMPSKVRAAALTARRQRFSGLDVAVTLAHLQTSCTDHTRRCEIGVKNELVFIDASVFERDFADFKAHIARLQSRDQRSIVNVRIGFVFGALEQKINAIGVRYHDDLRVWGHVQMIADITQAFGRLLSRVVDVIDHLVTRRLSH